MKTLAYYLERNLTSGNGIDTIIDAITIDVVVDMEIEVLCKHGYVNDSNINKALELKKNRYSVSGMFKTFGSNGSKSTLPISVQNEIYSICSPFSKAQIKRAIAKMEKQGLLKRKGLSDNQIRLGNYYVVLN